MLDWLAVGWNLAMTISGAFLVSLSFRSWPLLFDRQQAIAHTLMTILTILLISRYPHALVTMPPSLSPWADSFADLRYVPLVTLLLAYRPIWAVIAGLVSILPQFFDSLINGDWGLSEAPLLATVAVLLVGTLQKSELGILNFAPREAALRLPLTLLPVGLPFLMRVGLTGGTVPALLLLGVNLIGFLIGVVVLRSRFRLLAISARLSQQAHTDPLTGLWNRRQLEHDLSLLPVGGHILVVDLDYFKTINDRFGHDIGDEYLIAASSALNRALRSYAVRQPPAAGGRPLNDKRVWVRNQTFKPYTEQAYRLGGEEFALLTSVDSPEGAEALASRLMEEVRAVRHRSDLTNQITCSVGVARRLGQESPQDTLRRADEALMSAKSGGRNQAVTAPHDRVPASAPTSHSLRPAQPQLWEAIRTSLSLVALDRDLTTEDWNQLLQAAILSVPGAESGSINLLKEGRYVHIAQVGFDDELIGLSHSETAQLDWYGLDPEAWKRGEPRMLLGSVIAARSNRYASSDENPAEHFQTHDRVSALRSNLCLPIRRGDQIVGHLNLDRSSDHRPFDEEDLRVARTFADQVAVLTLISQRRADLARQRHDEQWLLDFSLSLIQESRPEHVPDLLIDGLRELRGFSGGLLRPEQTVPEAAMQAAGRYTVNLDWPDGTPGRAVFWHAAPLTPQDRWLIRQAARAANAASRAQGTRPVESG